MSEFKSIKSACDIIENELIRYSGNKVRGKAQDLAIKEIVNQATSPNSNTALVVFNQKNKIFPLRYREGQTEFFGKRGFSLLGLVVLFLNTKKIYDIVAQGYFAQDSSQIQAILSISRELIFEDYRLTFNAILRSDNEPAYSYPDNIRYIYKLNKKDATPDNIAMGELRSSEKKKTK